ncbi:hypothetical protein Mgra_00000520, partial [Meloidogyne graminicola]
IFFNKDKNILEDEKNKIWLRLSAFIISKSINEIKGKINIFIGQSKKNLKKLNKKEKNKRNEKEIKMNENNINKIILLIENNEKIEKKLNKTLELINWEELEKMVNIWNILSKINDWKDFNSKEIKNYLNEEKINNLENREYIKYLHTKEINKLLPDEWIDNEKLNEKSLFNELNSMKEEEIIFKIKNKIRQLLGEWMFIKLELKQPMLFRLDLLEYQYKLELYKQLFNNPLNNNFSLQSDINLNISFIYKNILIFINNLKEENEKNKFLKEFRKYWNEKIKNIVNPNIDLVCELTNYLLNLKGENNNLINPEMYKSGLQTINLFNKIHEEDLIKLFNNKDEIFKKFIKTNWGTRNRLLVYLNKNTKIVPIILEDYNNSLKELIKIELTEKEMLDLIEQFYKKVFIQDNNILETTKKAFSGLTLDLLVSIYNFDKKFEKTKILNEWKKIKQIILNIADSLVDISNKTINFQKARVIICKNIFYLIKDFPINNNKREEIKTIFNNKNNLLNFLKKELLYLKQERLIKPELIDEKLILENQNKLHSEMILKLKKERPEFRETMEGLN